MKEINYILFHDSLLFFLFCFHFFWFFFSLSFINIMVSFKTSLPFLSIFWISPQDKCAGMAIAMLLLTKKSNPDSL